MKKITFEDFSRLIFWNFKNMDNVNYNFKIIETLIDDSTKRCEGSSYFYKPIFIIMISIIECTIYDFLLRLGERRNEPIKLDSKIIDDIQDEKKPNKLIQFSNICKKI